MEEIVQKDGIKYHLIKTNKFKTNTIVFKLKSPINENEATMRALLPYVLQSGTNNYPAATEFRSYLDELYGATFNVDLQKKGEYHIISISMEIANEKFLKVEEPLLKKGLELLAEVVLHPKTDGNSFDSSIVQKEKRTLKQRIQSVYDDKMRYANVRLIEEMCKNEPYRIPVNGILADVDKITGESLYEYYKKVLLEDELDLYIAGDIDKETVISQCNQLFHFPERKAKKSQFGSSQQEVEKINTVIEKQEVNQGKLNIGFRTNTTYGEDDYFALQVFNGMFGGFSHSKLFLNVREKASLAYYAASSLESHKGLMIVMTGIEGQNFEKTKDIIQQQFEAMKKGEFTEKEFDQTKAVIKNQMLETLDTARGLIEVLYHNVISGKQVTEEIWMHKIDDVSKDDVIAVGKKISADTIYFLTGTEA